jgi:hypothetical protein
VSTPKVPTLAEQIIADLGVFTAESQSHETHELDPIDCAALVSHVRTQANTLRSTSEELQLCRLAYAEQADKHLATQRALEAVNVIAPRIVKAIPEYAYEMGLVTAAVAQADQPKPKTCGECLHCGTLEMCETAGPSALVDGCPCFHPRADAQKGT